MHAREIIAAREAEADCHTRLASVLKRGSDLMQTVGESLSGERRSAPERALGGAMLRQVETNAATLRALERYRFGEGAP